MGRWAIALAILAAIGLAGCKTTATAEQKHDMAAQCSGYGFKKGTDSFAACMMQLDQGRIAENRRRRIAIGQALADYGHSLQMNAAMHRPVNCTSSRGYGGIVNTTCQ